MARFQTLPDRIDCICVSVPDRQMCQNNGITISCNLTINQASPVSQTKRTLDITTVCGCCLWTIPAGISTIYVELWGAGGGGGGPGNCCCCNAGPGGGSGSYASATIAVSGGSQLTVCAGNGGTMGCAACTNGGAGNPSYVTGGGIGTLCAGGGGGGCSGACNVPRGCYGVNQTNFGCGNAGTNNSSPVANFAICACGEGGHMFGQPLGCRYETKGGSAPMAGGIGAWATYSACCPCNGNSPAQGGDFPGGGGAGANSSCCCGGCGCGGCGASGLVRIWY